MKISKVKLVDHGLKGIEVDYLKAEDKGGISFLNEFSKKDKRPIPKELRDKFVSLKPYMLDVCGVDQDKIEELEITGVHGAEDHFIITAKVKVLQGLTYALNTPNVKAENYVQYDKVMEVIDEIYRGVVSHIKSNAMISPQQFVMDFNESVKPEDRMSEEEINKMPEQEKIDYMMEYLEKKGAVILNPEDIDREPEAEEQVQLRKVS